MASSTQPSWSARAITSPVAACRQSRLPGLQVTSTAADRAHARVAGWLTRRAMSTAARARLAASGSPAGRPRPAPRSAGPAATRRPYRKPARARRNSSTDSSSVVENSALTIRPHAASARVCAVGVRDRQLPGPAERGHGLRSLVGGLMSPAEGDLDPGFQAGVGAAEAAQGRQRAAVEVDGVLEGKQRHSVITGPHRVDDGLTGVEAGRLREMVGDQGQGGAGRGVRPDQDAGDLALNRARAGPPTRSSRARRTSWWVKRYCPAAAS